MRVVQPVRVERRYAQTLYAKPERIFPLLCPVREKEWVLGWDPLDVYTNSGFAENDCVFTTGEETPDAFWVITGIDRKAFTLEILKITPGMTVGKISIALSETGAPEGQTRAEITYMYTAISKRGEEFVSAYSEEYFASFMRLWESELNEFLEKSENGKG